MKRMFVLLFKFTIIASFMLGGCDSPVEEDTISQNPVEYQIEAEDLTEEEPFEESSEPEHESDADNNEQTEAIELLPEWLNEDKKWQKLYYEVLYEFIKKPGVMFNVYDLDENGIPELLLSVDSSHARGVEIYTLNQDELLHLGVCGSSGDFQFDIKRKYIRNNFFNMGAGYLIIYKLENNEIIEIINFYFNDNSLIPEEYKINDDEVSKEVFEEESEKYKYDYQNDFKARKYYVTLDEIERVLTIENDVESQIGSTLESDDSNKIFPEIFLKIELTDLPNDIFITADEASDIVCEAYKKVHPDRDYTNIFFNTEGAFIIDDGYYYIIRGYSPTAHFMGTFGWYYVDVYTGEAYWSGIEFCQLLPIE